VSQTSTQAVRGGSVIGQSPGSTKLMMTLGLEVSLLDRFRFPTGNNLLIVMSLTVHRACTYKADGQGMGEFTPYTSGLFTVRIYGKLCYGSGGYCVEFRPGGADHSITSELNWGDQYPLESIRLSKLRNVLIIESGPLFLLLPPDNRTEGIEASDWET